MGIVNEELRETERKAGSGGLSEQGENLMITELYLGTWEDGRKTKTRRIGDGDSEWRTARDLRGKQGTQDWANWEES